MAPNGAEVPIYSPESRMNAKSHGSSNCPRVVLHLECYFLTRTSERGDKNTVPQARTRLNQFNSVHGAR